MKSATMTSKTIQLLIKSCLLPISFNLEKNVVRFSFWSKPTMVHLLFYWAPHLLAFILYWYTANQSGALSNFYENSSFSEKFSSFGVCLIFFKVYLILPLAKQLNSFPSHLIITDQMKFPKYGIWNILGFMMMLLGSLLFNIGLHGDYALEGKYKENLANHLTCLFYSIFQSFNWCIFSIVIQVWFETIARDKSKDIIRESKIFIRYYRQFTAALGNYFFYSFSMFQIISIFTLFLTCSKLILEVTLFSKYLSIDLIFLA